MITLFAKHVCILTWNIQFYKQQIQNKIKWEFKIKYEVIVNRLAIQCLYEITNKYTIVQWMNISEGINE